jgi:hypothetical protein
MDKQNAAQDLMDIAHREEEKDREKKSERAQAWEAAMKELRDTKQCKFSSSSPLMRVKVHSVPLDSHL